MSAESPVRGAAQNPEQAIEADEKGLAGWAAHPRLEVVDNSTPFDQKVTRVLRRICKEMVLPLPSHAPWKRFPMCGPVSDDVFLKAGVQVTTTRQTVHSLDADDFKLRVTKHDRGDGDVNFVQEERRGEALVCKNELASERQYDTLVRERVQQTVHKVVRSFVWQGQFMELSSYQKTAAAESQMDYMSLDFEPTEEEE